MWEKARQYFKNSQKIILEWQKWNIWLFWIDLIKKRRLRKWCCVCPAGEKEAQFPLSRPPCWEDACHPICLFLEGSFTPLLGANEGLTAANCSLQQAWSGLEQPGAPEATWRGAAIRRPPSSDYNSLCLSCTNWKVNIPNIHLLWMYWNEKLEGEKNPAWNVRWGSVGGAAAAAGWSRIHFQNHFFSFLLVFVFKNWEAFSFGKVSFPYLLHAPPPPSPLVITSPLPSALEERR